MAPVSCTLFSPKPNLITSTASLNEPSLSLCSYSQLRSQTQIHCRPFLFCLIPLLPSVIQPHYICSFTTSTHYSVFLLSLSLSYRTQLMRQFPLHFYSLIRSNFSGQPLPVLPLLQLLLFPTFLLLNSTSIYRYYRVSVHTTSFGQHLLSVPRPNLINDPFTLPTHREQIVSFA